MVEIKQGRRCMSAIERQHHSAAPCEGAHAFLLDAHVRRNRLFGLWAAGRQGLSGSDAQKYAARLACEDSPHYRARAVLDRVARDLVASGYAAPEEDLARALAASADRAQADVWAAGVAHRFG
jgi:hypothetical protein